MAMRPSALITGRSEAFIRLENVRYSFDGANRRDKVVEFVGKLPGHDSAVIVEACRGLAPKEVLSCGLRTFVLYIFCVGISFEMAAPVVELWSLNYELYASRAGLWTSEQRENSHPRPISGQKRFSSRW